MYVPARIEVKAAEDLTAAGRVASQEIGCRRSPDVQPQLQQ